MNVSVNVKIGVLNKDKLLVHDSDSWSGM